MRTALRLVYMAFLLIFVMYAGWQSFRNNRRLNELEKQLNSAKGQGESLWKAELELSEKTGENLELADKNRQLQKACEDLIATNKKLQEAIDRLIIERDRLLAAMPNR